MKKEIIEELEETFVCEECGKRVSEEEFDTELDICMECSIEECTNNNHSGMFVEKFECTQCGVYYWVEDRDSFDCPNCKISEEENKVITAYVSNVKGTEEKPYQVFIEQEEETKEYESYSTEEEAENRAQYINDLMTANWEEINI